MRQALRPGGLILIEGYRPEQLNYKTGGPSLVETCTHGSFWKPNLPGCPS
jgi:hypothetical protein